MASKSTSAARKPPTPAPRVASRIPSRSAPPALPARTAPPAASNPPPAASAPSKAPRKRSPPMDRALKYARLADKNVTRVLRLVGNWHGEATDEQKKMNEEIVAQLKQAAPLLERALLDVGLLGKTGFVPTEARGRAITEPFIAGEHVTIKMAVYNAELHGRANDFEVVVQVGNYVRIKPTGDPRATNLVVSRAHLELLDDGEDESEDGEDETPAEGDEGASAEDEGEGEGEGDTDELNFDQR